MIARIEEMWFRITKERDLTLRRELVYKIIPARATDQPIIDMPKRDFKFEDQLCS